MAVYTEVSDDELRRFLEPYHLGRLIASKGIAEGVENSNFLLQTEERSYILTLYEKRMRRGDLPFFLALMQHLADRGISVPQPIHDRIRRGPARAQRPAGRAVLLPRGPLAPARAPLALPGAGRDAGAVPRRHRRLPGPARQRSFGWPAGAA